MFKNLFYNPLNIKYKTYSEYISVSISDHRQYKDIYISINTDKENNVLVWITIVCKDKTIVCYCNNMDRVNSSKGSVPSLNIFYAPVHILSDNKNHHPSLYIYFRTNKSEKIEIMISCLNTPKENSGGFEKDKSLFLKKGKVIMYRHASAPLGHKTKVYIMGREYNVKGKRKIAMLSNIAGEYTEGFEMLSIVGNKSTYKIPDTLPPVENGSTWNYTTTKKSLSYKITSIKGDNLIITGDDQLFHCVKKHDGYAIQSIENLTNCNSPVISFNPALPIYPIDSEIIGEYDMTIGVKKDTISGKVFVRSIDDKIIDYVFLCDFLGWKEDVPLRSAVCLNDDELIVVTGETEIK